MNAHVSKRGPLLTDHSPDVFLALPLPRRRSPEGGCVCTSGGRSGMSSPRRSAQIAALLASRWMAENA